MSDENPIPFQSSSSFASHMDESRNSSISEECFFADATLDLEEARCIAYTLTPDLTQKLSIDNISDVDLPILGSDCPKPSALRESTRTSSITSSSSRIKNIDLRPVTLGSFGTNSNQNHSNTNPSADTDGNSSKGGRARVNINLNANGNLESSHDSDQQQDKNDVKGKIGIVQTRSIEMHSIHNNTGVNGILDRGGDFNHTNQPTYRPRPPRRPRDSRWITAFILTVPLLSLPYIVAHVIFQYPSPDEHEVEKSDAPTLFTLVIAIILARLFYLSRGGGEGEDRRYLTSQVLIVANMASCVVLPLLTLTFYYLHVYSTLYRIIVIGLAWLTMREIYTFASLFKANGNNNFMNEGLNDGQRAFFRMLVNASLDILSRSLRCQSFFRTVVFLLCVQFGILMGLRRALEYSYRMGTFEIPWILLVVGVGYWCVNVVIRLLGYLACGGVTAWFAEQSILMEDMERMRKREEGDYDDDNDVGVGGGDHDDGQLNLSRNTSSDMPEAYRHADARAYSLGIEFDEGMDDDYGDADDTLDMMHGPGGRTTITSSTQSRQWSGNGNGHGSENHYHNHHRSSQSSSTVKAFLISGLGKSSGSIIHCALLGGVANALWSFLRGVEWLNATSPRFAAFFSREYAYQGMDGRMGTGDNHNNLGDSSYRTLREKIAIHWQRFQVDSRTFVRNHHDMGLCHVAAYYKSYTRAANDVMALIDASGIEPILHGDVSSHMCSSISKSIAGIVVIYVWPFLPTSQKNDISVCEIMVMTFVMCYTLIYTMMEPLQASIKAVYVCFAQNHQSLSQAFPILYHRLDRMSSERNMV